MFYEAFRPVTIIHTQRLVLSRVMYKYGNENWEKACCLSCSREMCC